MKAKLVNSIPPGDWIYEVKFDGCRALALRGGPETKFLSRNQKDLGKTFPEIVEAIASLDLQDAIIDGEIVALDDQGRSSFQALQAFEMDTERPAIVFGISESIPLTEYSPFRALTLWRRFVACEPLRRVHKCVFGILALESELSRSAVVIRHG